MPRTLAIGDIHGCLIALKTLEVHARFQADDVIVTLGDYVDRGPRSRGVLDWLIERNQHGNLVALRGNHELMMLQSRRDHNAFQAWMMIGGDATVASYSPAKDQEGRLSDIPVAHWDFLENELVPYHEIASHFFVHANAYPDIPLEEQPDFMLYWEKYNDPPRHQSGKIMVCGHSSQKSGWPVANDNAVCIDTWACGDGWLSCLEVESGTIWQANELGDTYETHIDELE